MNRNKSSSDGFRNSGTVRQPRKPKARKIPQRGLGVAQLEKIRLEEEKNDPSSSLTPQPTAGLNNRSPSAPHIQLYPFSNDNLCGHVLSNPHLNVRQQSICPVDDATRPNNARPENNLLSSKYNQEVEKSTRSLPNQNHHESTFMSSFRGVVQCGSQQSSFFPSSMVNDIAANSSSAVLKFQTEPPSNQSLYYGNYRSGQPDETEKTVRMKRSCPFSLQEPSDPLLHCKLNPYTAHSLGKPTLYSNAGSLVINGNPSLRDGLPRFISTPEMHHTKDIRADNRTLDGGFLKLASSATMSSLPSSKSNQVHALDSDSQAGSDISNQQQRSFYSFFPAPNTTRDGQTTVMASHHSHETEEQVDLNLKL